MKILVDKIGRILTALIVVVGVYHLLIYCVNEELVTINKSVLYGIYHIAHNSIIVTLLYVVWREIRNKEGRGSKFSKSIAIYSIYFIYKIFLNVLFMIPFTNKLINLIIPNHDNWSFICVGIIITLLLWLNGRKSIPLGHFW